MILKESHNDRRRDIVGQVRHNLNGFSSIFLLCQPGDIHFEYIVIYDLHILVSVQRILKNRDQRPVDLHRYDFSRRTGQILGHSSDSRTDLQHTVIRPDFGRPDNLVQHVCIYEKVLPELFLENKVIFLQHRNCILRISQCRFSHPVYFLLKIILSYRFSFQTRTVHSHPLQAFSSV